jgi:endogenous inhibitor of DNA gyrase (YacG/DUF329 family)
MNKSLQVVYWRIRMKMRLIEYKGGKCQRCGYNKPIPGAYDFHHRNPDEKEFTITSKTVSYEKLKEEADKCDLLCATCHREVHHELNIKRREEIGLPHLQVELTCVQCNKIFVRRKYGQKYCSKACFHDSMKRQCEICKKTVPRKNKVGKYCSAKCQNEGRRKVAWPNKEELQLLLENNSMLAISKMYGVADHTVARWIKNYEL